ncbi:membrane protein insertase YidC [bacterium]|jgi:YidC/Oxa1 family membrane protein insertase|nr:membrane protein insertase YidC [bacterium]MBT4649199.1 membrane protein insertase YidC [bacterium]
MFFTIFYQPIFNLLVFLYNTIAWQDLGLAIVFLTIIVRLILYPLSKQAIRSQKSLQTIQPEIEAIKEKYKDNKEKMGPEIMALYKERKINPFGSCLPMLVQLPFLFAIYRVFFNELKDGAIFDSSSLYTFVANPQSLDIMAFGFLNLSDKSIVLAVLAGAAQFWQSKMMMSKSKAKNPAAAMTNQMMYFLPIITIVIGASFPAGLTFYWLLTTLFSVFQQYMVLGFKKKKPEVEVVETKS